MLIPLIRRNRNGIYLYRKEQHHENSYDEIGYAYILSCLDPFILPILIYALVSKIVKLRSSAQSALIALHPCSWVAEISRICIDSLAYACLAASGRTIRVTPAALAWIALIIH
jgi:hypothetical protein